MKTSYYTLFILLIIGISQSCDNGCDPPFEGTICQQQVVIDNDLYLNAVSSTFSITQVNIVADCLEISFSASGCDGNTWQVALYDSDEILTASDGDTNPRRMLRLTLENSEICEAMISKTMSFDISNLQYSDKIYLVLDNWDTEILYEY